MFKKHFLLIFSLWMINSIFMESHVDAQTINDRSQNKFSLIVLAPAHFHAVLLQKVMYPQIDPVVHVYAPKGEGVNKYLKFINQYNNRINNPTHWIENVYEGPDYLWKMLQGKSLPNKSIVVIAGNNQKKEEYITKTIDAGMNVLADKPMVITPSGFKQLQNDFEVSEKRHLLLYDIMTERYALTNILQKEFLHDPDIFGHLKKGTPENPSVIFKSVHYFYKEVSGQPLIRPTWYFDVHQQGEGIVDVTTHLIDLIQWECFPKTIFNLEKDVNIISARHWPTRLSLKQFSKVTGADSFPPFLNEEIKNGNLYVFANGEIRYTLKGIYTEVKEEWKYVAPKGSGDSFYSEINGTKASLIIYQDKAQNYIPTLYIKPVNIKDKKWEDFLINGFNKIRKAYPGITLDKQGDSVEVVIPQNYITSGEDQFSSVVKKYLQYLEAGSMPAWEKSFILTKYYITTTALKIANSGK